MGWVYRPPLRREIGDKPWTAQAHRALRQLDPKGVWLGGYVNRPVRGSSSLSVHAVGRAVDWQPSSAVAADRIIRACLGSADVQLLIWQRRQWGGRGGPGWRPYHGVDPHNTHLHVESRYDTSAYHGA